MVQGASIWRPGCYTYRYVGGTVVVTHAEQPQGDDVESDLRRKKSARVIGD